MLPLVLLTSLLAAQPAPADQCSDWKSCRDLAEAAAASEDYETFHDLAWRTMQLRRTSDPEVMYMLARAQSLSGRPHDALVMLGRIADLGVATDADTNPDFARVRSLPGWPELQARIEKLRAGEPADAAKAPARAEPPATAPTATPTAPAAVAREVRIDTVAQFSTPQFSPGGIAYDAVSRRYLVGNLPERKLTEIEEGSNRAATLAGAAAQFFDVKALEIDTHQGDLWVVSDGTSEGEPASAVHKLQLISGRVLKVFETPPPDLPTRFVDVAVSSGAGVLILDAAKPRIFRTTASGSLQILMALPPGAPTSVAPANGGHTAYVAYSDRLLRIDLQQRTAATVTARRGENVEGLQRIRWHRDSLVGVQSMPDGLRRIVRVPIERGARIAPPEVLDEWRDSSSGAASASLIGDDFYYLVPEDGQSVIRRIRLR